MAVVTMRQLLESGVHFGHQTRRWNPKMKRFIMTERNGIYIIDLQQSLSYIDTSYAFIKDTVAKGGTIMFVGTKKQAQEAIAEQATRVGMPYVNQRWLGGMLTNFQTVHQRINRLKELDEIDFDDVAGSGRTKKELLQLKRERDKLDKTLGGIREMSRTPSAVWIVDTNKEHLAVEEARKLRIPIIGILDTNCDPDQVDYPIPGNDDAIRAVGLLTRVVADAVADGLIARSGAKYRGRGEVDRRRRAAGRLGARLLEGEAEKAAVEATGGDAAPRHPGRRGHRCRRRGHRGRGRPRRRGCDRGRRRAAAEAHRGPGRGCRRGAGRGCTEAAGRGCHRGAAEAATEAVADHRRDEGGLSVAITAADVKKLRDLTGAGMMDAKKALEEADGDFDKAVEVLRVKGAAKAAEARRASARPPPGLVATSGGALVELNCETDFVAKNEDFVATAQQIADAADRGQGRGHSRRSRRPRSDGKTVGEVVEDLAITIGEKIELGEVAYFDGPSVAYMHQRAADLPPAVGVLVEYDGDDAEAARGAAMQIAAMRPQYLTRDEVPADVVAKEREIAEATAREEGKPEQAIAKIIEGRLNGFFKDVVAARPAVGHREQEVGQGGARRGRHRP